MRRYQRVVSCVSRWEATGDQVWLCRLECQCEVTKPKRKRDGKAERPAPLRVYCRRHPLPVG